MIFCPVKCEAYFADNGGFRDESDELFQRFTQAYGSVVAQIRAEYARVAQLYCPIDTLGWAELRSAIWAPDPREASGWRFEPTFTLRADALAGTAKLRTKGVDDLLAALCNQLMAARRAAERSHLGRGEPHLRPGEGDGGAPRGAAAGPVAVGEQGAGSAQARRRRGGPGRAGDPQPARGARQDRQRHRAPRPRPPCEGPVAVDIHVETRGSARSAEYRFLGTGPGERSWRRYGDRTAFEYPTVLVERDAEGWRAYLGGIPSSRREPGGSTNRVAIVLTAPADTPPSDEERDVALRLIAAWLDDTAEGREPGILQRELDRVFPEQTVDRLYTEAAPGEVAALMGKVAAALPTVRSGDPEATATGRSWIAPMRFERARTPFLERVHALLTRPDDGAAVLVNLVDDAESYELDAAEPPTAVLAADPDRRMRDALAPLAPKKAQAPQPTPQAGGLRRVPRRAAAVALAALAVVALIVGGGDGREVADRRDTTDGFRALAHSRVWVVTLTSDEWTFAAEMPPTSRDRRELRFIVDGAAPGGRGQITGALRVRFTPIEADVREEIDGGSSAEFARGLAKAVGDGAWNVEGEGMASALDEGQRARTRVVGVRADPHRLAGGDQLQDRGVAPDGALSRGPACDGDHPPRRPRLTSRTSEPRPRPGGGRPLHGVWCHEGGLPPTTAARDQPPRNPPDCRCHSWAYPPPRASSST